MSASPEQNVAEPPSADAHVETRTRAELVPWWRSFVFRFVGIFASTITLVLVVAIYWLHSVQAREVADKFGLALESIAGTAAPFVSGEDLRAVHTNADASRPEFRRVRTVLQRIRHENQLAEDAVYVLRPGAREGEWEFAAMLQRRTFIGDAYQPPPMLLERYRWVWAHRDAVRTGLYTDAHGTFISGLAPVLDDSGRVVGILHVDYGVGRYLAEVDARTRVLIGEGVALVLFVFALGAWMHRRLRRKALALLGGTNAIRSEDYDYRISVSGRDELASVAASLNDVIRRLKERFEMLKFLPRHTAMMIREASAHGRVRLDHATRVRIVVFESDIRGFSSISENLSPEQIIGMLNRYIREQAEIVEAAGGSIDKYMGDAVLAVFEGEGMERRALRCAIDIQAAVERLNGEGAFVVPIHIGIGLSVGEVVMGNMGSERRMEHTVIGATVNLAARLCSNARPGEVVVQKTLWDAASSAVDVPTVGTEEVRVKGFEHPISCVRLAPHGSAATRPSLAQEAAS